MKVIHVNAKGVIDGVSNSAVRPTADGWKVVPDNQDFYVGQKYVEEAGTKGEMIDLVNHLKKIEDMYKEEQTRVLELEARFAEVKKKYEELVAELPTVQKEHDRLAFAIRSGRQNLSQLGMDVRAAKDRWNAYSDQYLKDKKEKALHEIEEKARAELVEELKKEYGKPVVESNPEAPNVAGGEILDLTEIPEEKKKKKTKEDKRAEKEMTKEGR